MANRGTWAGTPGNFRLVALSGDIAPGVGREFCFFVDSFGINAAGQVAFWAAVNAPGTTDCSSVIPGLWVEGRGGAVEFIAAVGEPLIFDRDTRMVTTFFNGRHGFTTALDQLRRSAAGWQGGFGNQDGRISAFNDDGKFTFGARFDDGTSGIFIAQ